MSSENERKIAALILKAGSLPGYKKHPFDTYAEIAKLTGITGINHPRDVFVQDIKQLRIAAENLIGSHKRWAASVGFATGAPGGLVGLFGGTAVDLEEYLRRLFLLAQEVGQVYGLIPNPFTESIDDSMDNYFESAKEEILKAMLIGLGTGVVTMGVVQIAKLIAEKEANEIVKKKISEKVITKMAMELAKLLGIRLTKKGLAQIVGKSIPIVGGGVNAVVNYKAIDTIGENLMENFEKVHLDIRAQVLNHWDFKNNLKF